MYCSAIFAVYFLTPSRRTADGIRSDGGRNPIGRRTESDRTADGNRSDGGRNPSGGAAVSAAPTEQTERVFPQNTRNTQNRLAEMCRPQIGTDAHRLGRYDIPVIPTPTTEQTTNTGSANRRRLRHSCRSHSNMTYSSSRQLAMPTKNISHRLHRTHRKAGCGDSSGGIPADAASKTSPTERAELTERQGAKLLTEPTLAAAEAGDLRY